jgi:hypothetical protein
MLLTLIGAIVGLSYLPVRGAVQATIPYRPKSRQLDA